MFTALSEYRRLMHPAEDRLLLQRWKSCRKLMKAVSMCGYSCREDIEMEVYRSSGAGGQKVNKTSSAVRLRHKPTGTLWFSCQTQRKLITKIRFMLKMLVSKLVEIKEREHLKQKSPTSGRSKRNRHRAHRFTPMSSCQILSFRFCATGYEVGNINAVMDGDFLTDIHAYLKSFLMRYTPAVKEGYSE